MKKIISLFTMALLLLTAVPAYAAGTPLNIGTTSNGYEFGDTVLLEVTDSAGSRVALDATWDLVLNKKVSGLWQEVTSFNSPSYLEINDFDLAFMKGLYSVSGLRSGSYVVDLTKNGAIINSVAFNVAKNNQEPAKVLLDNENYVYGQRINATVLNSTNEVIELPANDLWDLKFVNSTNQKIISSQFDLATNQYYTSIAAPVTGYVEVIYGGQSFSKDTFSVSAPLNNAGLELNLNLDALNNANVAPVNQVDDDLVVAAELQVSNLTLKYDTVVEGNTQKIYLTDQNADPIDLPVEYEMRAYYKDTVFNVARTEGTLADGGISRTFNVTGEFNFVVDMPLVGDAPYKFFIEVLDDSGARLFNKSFEVIEEIDVAGILNPIDVDDLVLNPELVAADPVEEENDEVADLLAAARAIADGSLEINEDVLNNPELLGAIAEQAEQAEQARAVARNAAEALSKINGPVFKNPNVAKTVCSDVASDFWGLDIVNSLIEDELFPVELSGNTVFCRVNREVTRKEFTAWLLHAYQPELVKDIADFEFDYSNSPLSDISGDDVYDPYVIMAYQNGIINGYPDGLFRPNQTINRAEVLKILLRSGELYMDSEEEKAALISKHRNDLPTSRFTDVERDDQYFYGYLLYAMHAYDDEMKTFLIEGRTGLNGSKYAAMGDPVLFGEAAKILLLSKQL